MRRAKAPAVPSTDSRGDNTKAQTHDAFSGRLDSGRGGLFVSGSIVVAALPVASTTGRAKSARGVSRNADHQSHYRLALRERQDRNDVPQLPDSMQEVWERS
jgi:hypothetical protein